MLYALSMPMDDVLERLYHSGLKFLVPLTPEETYKLLVGEAKKIVNARHGTILLWNGREMKRVYSTISFPLPISPRKNGYIATTFRSGEPHVISAKKLFDIHPILKSLRLKYSVMVPLSYQHHALGVLILTINRDKKITKKELQLLKLYGAIASLSIRKTQLYLEARQAVETRDLFINLITHELRTPLTAINSYVQYLEKRIKELGRTTPQWVNELSFSTHIVMRIVNELLHLNLLESGEFSYAMDKISFTEVIKHALQTFSQNNPQAKVHFLNDTRDDKTFIIGDQKRLKQAIENILDNAKKFSSASSSIGVSLKKKDSLFIFQVQDKGLGIPKGKKQKLFQAFYKAHEGYHEGMGLGLFLTKSIIAQHNGAIHISSTQNKGTKVTITLPEYYE